MRTPIRLLGVTVLVAAFGTVAVMINPWADTSASAADVQAQEDSPAADALRAALEPYAGRTEYAGTFRISQSMTIGGETRGATAELDYRLQMPGMFYAQFRADGSTLTLACDGQRCRIYVPETRKYLDLPAPEDVLDVLDWGLLGPVGMPRMRTAMFGLFGQDAVAELLAGAGEPELFDSDILDGREVRRVVAKTGEDTLTVWIAQDVPQVLKVELDPWHLVEELRKEQADLEAITFAIVSDPPMADAPLPEDAFTITVPEDAQRAADLEDLFLTDLRGKPMIDFELPGLEAGSTWRLSDHRGKVIALSFWATWCGPCRMEMPALQDIYRDLEGEGFLLLGVNQGEGPEKITGFLKEMKLDIPVALDREGRTAAAYYTGGKVPTLVLIGRDGVIRAVHRGYAPGLERFVRQQVEMLLAGEPPLPQ